MRRDPAGAAGGAGRAQAPGRRTLARAGTGPRLPARTTPSSWLPACGTRRRPSSPRPRRSASRRPHRFRQRSRLAPEAPPGLTPDVEGGAPPQAARVADPDAVPAKAGPRTTRRVSGRQTRHRVAHHLHLPVGRVALRLRARRHLPRARVSRTHLEAKYTRLYTAVDSERRTRIRRNPGAHPRDRRHRALLRDAFHTRHRGGDRVRLPRDAVKELPRPVHRHRRVHHVEPVETRRVQRRLPDDRRQLPHRPAHGGLPARRRLRVGGAKVLTSCTPRSTPVHPGAGRRVSRSAPASCRSLSRVRPPG